MKQKTSDKFIRIYNSFSEDVCWNRAEKAAKHLLSSIVFKECSTEYFKSSGSVLLSPIGYYYSIFHMSMTLCWLNPEIEEIKLSKIRHSTLQNFVKTKFVNQGLLDESYSSLMQELKDEREWLNYTFGEYQYDFFENAIENEKLLNTEYQKSLLLIDEICTLLKTKFDIKQRIKTYIADSKGEDLLLTYLSESEQEFVTNILVEIGFSN